MEVSKVLPFFFVIFSLFNGIVRPYTQLPRFWSSWLYHLNPSTYWMSGVVSATMSSIPVACSPNELTTFNAPAGETCFHYASRFLESAGGYLINPDATQNCGYCAFKNGDEYLRVLGMGGKGEMWRDLGIFAVFCVSNWMLVYFFIYTVRIRGWSFGLGWVFRRLERGIEGVKRLLMRTGRKGISERKI